MLHLNYKAYGHSGHPIIILHGLLGMLDNWQTHARRLAERGHRVYVPDQRNHGRSPHSETFNYDVMAQDVRDFMRQHHLASGHLLGHSMGGKTAMQVALAYPQLVDTLIVADIAPRPYPVLHDEILDAMCSIPLRRMATRHEVDAALSQRIPGDALRQFILKNLTRNDAGELKWRVNLAIIRRHYPEIAGDIPAAGVFGNPALFIRGGRSHYLREEDRPRIRELFPRSKVVTIAHAGHWIHADAPDRFFESVDTFLSHHHTA